VFGCLLHSPTNNNNNDKADKGDAMTNNPLATPAKKHHHESTNTTVPHTPNPNCARNTLCDPNQLCALHFIHLFGGKPVQSLV